MTYIKEGKIKKLLLSVITITLIFTLSACNNEEASEDGGLLTYSANEIVALDSQKDNAYVLNEEDEFSPLLMSATGFDGVAETSSDTRFVAFPDAKDPLIPEVNSKNKLVVVFSSKESIPTDIVLERYVDKGYTIGTQVGINEDGTSTALYTEGIEDTSFTKKISSNGDDTYDFTKINGQEVPTENIDPNILFFLGLEKDKTYTLGYYQGTKYTETNVIADTHVLQSKEVIRVNNAYKKTEDGYFEINLPSNLKSGYYYLSDIGLFRYEADIK